MPQRQQTSSAYPSAGDRAVHCTLQYATPTTDTMGGRTEPKWTDFGTWWAKVTSIPIVPNEIEAVNIFQVEGPYRRDLWDRFHGGFTLRIKTTQLGLTLKVMLVDNPQLSDKTLVAHCARATNTQ